MSVKNLDKHNRWRNKTVAFRVSPEEDEQLEIFVKLIITSWLNLEKLTPMIPSRQ